MSGLPGVGGVPLRCRSDVSRELFFVPDFCAVATYVAPTKGWGAYGGWLAGEDRCGHVREASRLKPLLQEQALITSRAAGSHGC